MRFPGSLTITELVRRVLQETGYTAALELDKSVEARIRLENLNELVWPPRIFREQNHDASLAAFLRPGGAYYRFGAANSS